MISVVIVLDEESVSVFVLVDTFSFFFPPRTAPLISYSGHQVLIRFLSPSAFACWLGVLDQRCASIVAVMSCHVNPSVSKQSWVRAVAVLSRHGQRMGGGSVGTGEGHVRDRVGWSRHDAAYGAGTRK